MKRQGRQAETFCAAPEGGTYAALVFGKSGAPVSEYADLLARKWRGLSTPPLDLTRMAPEDAKADPGLVMDALFSESLFGGANLLQVSIQKETEARPFLEAIEALETATQPPAGRLLIIAGDLTTKSKLRKTFEDGRRVTSLMLFERSERDFEAWVKSCLRDSGVRLVTDAETALIQTLLEDQSLAASELEKLTLYSLDRDEPLTLGDIQNLIALEDQSSHYELIDLALDGKLKDLASGLDGKFSDGSGGVSVLIGLVNQLKRLLRAHEVADSGVHGSNIGQRLTPRVFDRQWPDFERRMQKWAPERIISLLAHIETVDTACRRAASPQEALVRKLLLDVGQAAQLAGRQRA